MKKTNSKNSKTKTKIPSPSPSPSSDLVLLVQSYEQIKADLAELDRLDKEEEKRVEEAEVIFKAVSEVADNWKAGHARSRRVKKAELENVMSLLRPALQLPQAHPLFADYYLDLNK